MNILAGDLGGTKTLLAIFKNNHGNLQKLHQRRYQSAKWPSLGSILSDFIESLPNEINSPTHGCLAVAGPVNQGACQITNLGWYLEEQKLSSIVGFSRLELINDFCGLVYGLPFLEPNQTINIQTPCDEDKSNGAIAVLGAGTGLGIAKGLQTPNGLIAIASEGGHSEFAPRSDKEWKISQWLKADLNLERLSVERIVSGNGLGHIANWRLKQSDAKGHHLSQEADDWRNKISSSPPDLPALASQAASKGDPIMKEALDIWISAYGSAAGDLALQELCTGGLWIAGGTAAKHQNGLRSKTFLEAMRNKGRFTQFIKKIPVRAVIDQEAGLIGAACRARMLSESSGKLS